MIYLQLFWSFLQIGLFSFGGGDAAIPLIPGQIVERHGRLSMPRFTDLITISQLPPGPIALPPRPRRPIAARGPPPAFQLPQALWLGVR